ncbi:MarR family winged helix-turn-helix transcriptional regulator [Myxococcus fulvus]|uniref:MarR family winged helix-turn-helix transcriptional regulator n=1 Tax=Myxococcus TaxID=32 RepID=UPI00200A5E3B|nr:MarR family transcriptional regulator [Myxococcus fulvus]MCK8496454.1 MarR family transcriptional regulator [Myxococcus fulvus]
MKRKDALEDVKKLQASSLGYVLIRCGQLFNELGMQAVNSEAGYPMMREVHARILPYLENPDGVRITELARSLGVTKQAVQPVIAELAEFGAVRIEPDPDDARARRVLLTEKGIAAMRHGTTKLVEIDRRVAKRLGADETRELHGLLTRLLEVLKARD